MKKITIAFLMLFAHLASAQDGVLDTSFGTNGYFMTGGSDAANYYQFVDGKIMYRAVNKIYRLTESGTLDTGFGINGSITMAQPGTNARYGFVVSNNKVCAFSRNTSGLSNFIYYMGRYNMNGTPDATLGAGTGSITLEQQYFDGGLATATDASGNIIVGTNTHGGNNVDSDVVARKYNADGVFQQSEFWGLQFGYNISSSSIGLDTWDGTRDVKVAPNGNVVFTVGMTYYGTPTPPERYAAGYVTMRPGIDQPLMEFNGFDSHYGSVKSHIAFDADSNVYSLTGASIGYNSVPDVTNYIYKKTANGASYNAFGTNGELAITLLFGSGKADFSRIAVQPDGKLLLAGVTTTGTSAYVNYNMILARFNADGTLDTTFGNNGYVLHDIDHPTSTDGNNRVSDLFLSPDATAIYMVGFNNENSIFLKYSNPSLEPLTVPDFTPIAAICSGDTAPALQATSNNGVSGTWSPATIDNTTSGTYTFTPDASEHATGAALTVTVNQPTTSTIAQSACENYTWSANGMVYTESGAYTNVTTNAAGCTHTTTLNLTINHNTTASLSATACDTYTWSANGVIYTTGGTYAYVTTNAAGCTHTTTLELTLNNSVAPTGASAQTFVEGAMLSNIAVSPSSVVWYGSLANALAHENPIAASTILTDGATYYAVNTSAQGCPSAPFAVTVSVTLAADSFDAAHFSLYPNPTSDSFTVTYSKEISNVTLMNVLGQQVLAKDIHAKEGLIDISHLNAGTYFVKVTADNQVKTMKVIKK